MIWYMYYAFIEWQVQKRKENDKEVQAIHPSLNISIIASCCAVIEGFLFTIIKDYLFLNISMDKTKKSPEEVSNIMEEKIAQLESATFDKYKNLFSEITGIKISEMVNPITFAAINIMFQFRNKLLHGNEIEVHYHKNSDMTLNNVNIFGNYKNIIKYGIEKKIIVLDFKNDTFDILTNEFVDHFFCHTTKFICEVYDYIPERFKGLSTDIFRIKENLKECA